MANKIQIKRNSTSGSSTVGLDVGELGYNTVDQILYVGNSGAQVAATACLTKSGTLTNGNVLVADGVNGKVKDSTFILGKSVPANAELTDTKNTAGATHSTSKIFLIGATAQNANPQTYSRSTTFINSDGTLVSTAFTGTATDMTMDAGTY